MSHLDDAAILSLRDSERADVAGLDHVRTCDDCERAVFDARARATLVHDALSSLDDAVDVEVAKAAVRSRLDESRNTGLRRRSWMGHMGRAAAVLLIAAGAVSALPGSPVRRLLQRAPETGAGATSGTAAPNQNVGPAGIAVPVPEGRIRVVVREAEPGSELDVIWSDGSTARIIAPAGSRFAYTDGRAEVVPAKGDVTVEIPRTVSDATLEVDGRTYLAGSSDNPLISGPVIEPATGRVRFRIPER
jgi:hypothetical protein